MRLCYAACRLLTDAGGLDELGQLEGRLVQATLALQVLALLGPVPWDGHGVAVGLQGQRGRGDDLIRLNSSARMKR